MKSTCINAFLILLLFACERENEKIFDSIEGKWRGTLAEVEVRPLGLPIPISEDDESFDTEIEFKPEGKLIVDEDGQRHGGTYQLIGDELIIEIDLSVENLDFAGKDTLERLDERRLIFFREQSDEIEDPDGGLKIKGKVKVTLHFQRV